MAHAAFPLTHPRPQVVGSIGSSADLAALVPSAVRSACDLVEIRLDLLSTPAASPPPWRHLLESPLIFTARRADEGGGGSALSAAERMALLEPLLAQAAWLDIEVASIGEMRPLLAELATRGIPWLASFHDFAALPATAVLEEAARRARDAGAGAFKAAARLHQVEDLARLAQFQLADHGLPVATMGMGPLAAVSRLLCAQCGSVLNYGYLGHTATAPGQWDAALLKQAIARLVPHRGLGARG